MNTTIEDYILFCAPISYQATDSLGHKPYDINTDSSTYAINSNQLEARKREKKHFDGPRNLRKKCSGKNCKGSGKTLLMIAYINKTGLFCDFCTENLIHDGLATKIGNN